VAVGKDVVVTAGSGLILICSAADLPVSASDVAVMVAVNALITEEGAL